MRQLAVTALVLVLAACGGESSATSTTAPPTTLPAGEPHTVFTHCGWYETLYDDVVWTPSNIARGSSPDGTDSIATEGTVVRQGDRLLFTADSGLVVVLEIAPPDLPPIPPCD